MPRGAGGDPPPRAPRRHLPPQRGGQARHPRLRRRLRRPHLLRRRHHRPGDHARPLRAADEVLRPDRALRGVVHDGAGDRRGRRVLRRRHPQRRRRLDGALPGEVGDPRLRRQRSGLEADHQRPDLHRRRHRDGLPGRRQADGHGDDPVPPDDAGGQGLPDHRGRPRRGRPPAQRQGRALHGDATRRTRWSSPRATSSRGPSRPRSTRAAASPTAPSRSTSPSVPKKRIHEALREIVLVGRDFAGVDITHEPIRIKPGNHYTMGGVKTDVDGRTDIPGLYAAGEIGLRLGPRRQPPRRQLAARHADLRPPLRRRRRRPGEADRRAQALAENPRGRGRDDRRHQLA